MTYDDVLTAVHSRRTFSTGGPCLDRIRRLTDALGQPQEQYQTVHIAGTNGKGSVSAMTAAALQRSGKRVGLFTSPYLRDFRERIRVDGENISKQELVDCYAIVMEQERRLERAGYEPINEFELVTALGFLAFQRANVDVAVLEVGLGGRTDPTNIISAPAACCITSISLDHTEVLGDTLEQIAEEKAGIIKKFCPVVTANQAPEVYKVISERAKLNSAPLSSAPAIELQEQNCAGTHFLCGSEEIFIPLLGDYQTENAAAAFQLCRVLGLPENTIIQAFASVSWPGRLQYIPGKPDYLVDAGHNPAGIQALCRTLDRLFGDRKITAVVSMMKDKDYVTCIQLLSKHVHRIIGCSLGMPRSLAANEIAAAASCPAAAADTMAQALQMANKDGTLIVVCGSVYGAGAALDVLM